ncbi:MAG: hypothetical protein K5891_10935 [Lachnospiraceae bacterium]|nr:hypothetical protein [Lachnospiraceae bacterium]
MIGLTGVGSLLSTYAKQAEAPFSAAARSREAEREAHAVKTQEMRDTLREMKRQEQAKKTSTLAESYLEDLLHPDEKKAEEEKQKLTDTEYRYKEVSNQIRQAKTSVSAGRAVLAAKRKVAEIRRKMNAAGEDSEGLRLALTHAKRMELAARRKKHHLELEELAEHTRKQDELREKENASGDMRQSLFSAYEEKLTEAEDDIFAKREEEREAIEEKLSESGIDLSEDLTEELDRLLSELGEEQIAQLEEAMDLVESLEIIDPHMSKEDLEELKRKHRASEEKALMKADMDYLKGMVKLLQKQVGAVPGMSGGSTSAPGMDAGSMIPSFDPGFSEFSGGFQMAPEGGIPSGGFDISI